MLTKVIRKLTVQSIIQNKKRSVATIIGIMLSCALICAVAGSVSSAQATLIHYEKASDGDFHAMYINIPGDSIETVRAFENVSRTEAARVVGYAYLPESINPDKPYLHILSVTENAAQVLPFRISEGRLPKNDSELLIADHVRTNGGLSWKIGDTITLDTGCRQTVDDAFPLLQNNPYEPETVRETITDAETKTYTIVGIMDRPGMSFEGFSAPGYTAVTGAYAGENEPDTDAMYYVTVTFSPVSKAFESADALYQKLSETYSHIGMTVNKELIDYEGGARQELMGVLTKLAAIIIFIILLTSVFVIRNSFQISVSEKVRQYGILRSVGATSKQIEKSVLYEGFLLGAAGIPAGVLLGVFAVRVLMWITDVLLGGELLSTGFVFSVSPVALIVSVAVSAVTIFLSCLLPAKRAGRMSAIEAIRGNRETKEFKKIKCSPKLIKRLFGIGGVIASNSLQRSRKKYRTTVVSLVVSMTVFIAMSWFTESLGRAAGNVYADTSYNFIVSAPDSSETYQDIVRRCSLTPDNYSYEYGIALQWDTSQYGSAFANENKDPEGKEIALLIFLNREYFEIYAKRLGITQNLDQTAILVDYGMQIESDSGKRTISRFYEGIAPGDEIVYEIPPTENEGRADTLAITITDYRTEISDMPMGSEGIFYQGGVIFVSEDYGKEDNLLGRAQLYNMHIHTEEPDELERTLMRLRSENDLYSGIFVQNIAASAALEKRLLLVVNIFLYGFIIVITLIGVTNVFNAITTNMLLRAREFAMLKSVGMTSSQFRRMIFLESALYGTSSLAFGVPLGTVLSYLLYSVFSEQFDMGYRLPLVAILIAVTAVYAITGLTMWYSMSKINAQNTIDVIRAEAV